MLKIVKSALSLVLSVLMLLSITSALNAQSPFGNDEVMIDESVDLVETTLEEIPESFIPILKEEIENLKAALDKLISNARKLNLLNLSQPDAQDSPEKTTSTNQSRPAVGQSRRNSLPLDGILAEIERFFQKRSDVRDNITKWSGKSDPLYILTEWIKITHERGEDFQTAMSILECLQPQDFLKIRPDIARSVLSSTGVTDPLQVLKIWLRNGPKEQSMHNVLIQRIIRVSEGSSTLPDLPPQEPTLPPVDDESPAPGEYAEYPRPDGDNGWGVHWFPTTGQSGAEVDRMVEEIARMHVKWVLFLNEGTNLETNMHLVSALTAKGIMPVMRIYYGTVHRADSAELQRLKTLVVRYRSVGVHYFQIFNEVNLECEWEGGKLPADSVQQFADAFLPRARAVAEAGGIPGIPGPAFGYIKHDGTYGNGSDYFREMIDEMVNRGEKSLLSKCVVIIHNYTTDSDPADESKTEKFWQFRTFRNILTDRGLDIPMIGGEGGTRPEDVGGDLGKAAAWTMWSYDYMQRAPDYLFCFTPWLLAAPDWNEWHKHAWFDAGGRVLQAPIVSEMKRADPPVRYRHSDNPVIDPVAPDPTPAPVPNDGYDPAKPETFHFAPDISAGEAWFPPTGGYDSGDLRRSFLDKMGKPTMIEALVAKMNLVCPQIGKESGFTVDCAVGFYELLEAMYRGGFTFMGTSDFPPASSMLDAFRKAKGHIDAGREVGIKKVR